MVSHHQVRGVLRDSAAHVQLASVTEVPKTARHKVP